jgi:prophage maintenance system killer protein
LSSETFPHEDIEKVVNFNRRMVKKRGELFEIDKAKLFSIFDGMIFYDHVQDRRERIIKKAARILAGVSYNQPFGEGNKRTALATTLLFLRRNGFNLPVYSRDEKNSMYSLLIKTIEKFPNDPSIDSEIERYLFERTIPYFIKD